MQQEPPISMLIRAALAGAVIWLCLILAPVARQVPEFLQQIRAANQTAADFKARFDKLPFFK